jgi:chromate transport protein ChrA
MNALCASHVAKEKKENTSMHRRFASRRKGQKVARWIAEITIYLIGSVAILGFAGVVTAYMMVLAGLIAFVVIIELLVIRPIQERIRRRYRPGGKINLNEEED